MPSNELLELKGSFSQRKGNPAGPPVLPKGGNVSFEHVNDLIKQLEEVKSFWRDSNLNLDPLVGVYYTRVIAKSNRLSRVLARGKEDPSNNIVGARFYGDSSEPKHLITYRVDDTILSSSITLLKVVAEIIQNQFGGNIDAEKLKRAMAPKSKTDFKSINKTTFGNTVRDAFYVRRFGINREFEKTESHEIMIVSLFENKISALDQLKLFDIEPLEASELEGSFKLTQSEFMRLQKEAPFLISMSTDLSKYEPELPIRKAKNPLPAHIPAPEGEYQIGVIDTGFFEEAYFADWVETDHRLGGEFGKLTEKDKAHGTAVSSIIVDGPALNPELEDNCGRFRVKHFVVAKSGDFDSFQILRNIEQIVKENPRITVWNLSLGSKLAIDENAISPEAAILDRLQSDNNVIFIVAGTNDTGLAVNKRIGAPADSVNSIVVNSVDLNNDLMGSSRRGPVLQFHSKPDVCAVGGTEDNPITVAGAFDTVLGYGTSYAAPWITRKIAFLIYKMGLPREIAKALVIDSAIGWKKFKESSFRGFGTVPRNIEDVLNSDLDEIRFFIRTRLQSYETSTMQLPIPMKKNNFPFAARATLCYFPQCTRKEGVDYTRTEVSLRLGRVLERTIKRADDTEEKKFAIKPINNDKQDTLDAAISEDVARDNYRKWDNVKHIGEIIKPGARAKKSYGFARWGLAFTLKDRAGVLAQRTSEGTTVGVVVTLKDLHGNNRIDEFVFNCQAAGWIVNRINMETRLDLQEELDAEIEFEA